MHQHQQSATRKRWACAAAVGNHRVNLSGSIFIHDDDLWPNPDDNGTHIFSDSVQVGGDVFSKTFTTEDCVGGEVRGHLSVIVEDQTSTQIKVRARGRLFEQESCNNDDLDGDSGERVMFVPLGSTRTMTFRVNNGEPGDGGYNDYTLRVQNLQA